MSLQGDTDAVLKQIDSAVDVFRDLEIAWEKTRAKMQTLQDLGKKEDAIPHSEFSEATIHNVINGWNAFGASGMDRYSVDHRPVIHIA